MTVTPLDDTLTKAVAVGNEEVDFGDLNDREDVCDSDVQEVQEGST